MAGIAVTLKQARDLYVQMGEAAATLKQAASEAEQHYQRMETNFIQTGGAARECQNELLAVRRELKAARSGHAWLLLFVSCIGGLVGALAIHLFPRY